MNLLLFVCLEEGDGEKNIFKKWEKRKWVCVFPTWSWLPPALQHNVHRKVQRPRFCLRSRHLQRIFFQGLQVCLAYLLERITHSNRLDWNIVWIIEWVIFEVFANNFSITWKHNVLDKIIWKIKNSGIDIFFAYKYLNLRKKLSKINLSFRKKQKWKKCKIKKIENQNRLLCNKKK